MAGELVARDGDIEWGGLLMGAGSPYAVTNISGWYGLPIARRVSTNRPGRHGALPGELRAGERVVEAEVRIRQRPTFSQAAADLSAALAWNENPTEQALVVQLDGQATMVQARVINYALPTPAEYAVGYTKASIQWAASDPRRYSLTLGQATTGLPSPSVSGLYFPLAFPLDFGPGQAGGQITLTNSGNCAAWPVFEAHGPLTGPEITDADTGRRLAFNDDFEILAGQTLRIDTDLGAVSLGSANRRSELATAEWFPVPPGVKRVRFDAAGGSGSLTGFVRHAWMT